jgi:transcriptional regulator with XRE-family HTH domain
MKACPECQRDLKPFQRDEHHYAASGLGNVYLRNVEVVKCRCGEAVVLRSHPTLLRILTKCLAFKPALIRGHELRFVRQVLGHKAKHFAAALSVAPEHLSRIENSREPLSPAMDKLLRAHIWVELAAKYPELVKDADAAQLRELLSSRIGDKDRRLRLFVEFRGSRLRAGKPSFDFEFRKAA